MKSLRRFACGGTLLVLFVFLIACKVADDAVAASEQMTATAAGLMTYYSRLPIR